MLDNVKSTVDDAELVAKRRAQLVQAAITLFSRVGYHVATVKDIAEEAKVSPGLIYQYVPDKQDLLFLALLHICQRNKEEIPAALEGIDDPIGRLHASIDAYTRVIAANQQAVLLTYRETKSLKREYIEILKRMELETNALIANCVDEGIRRGYLPRVNVELLVYRIITGAHAWALKHWRLPKIVSLTEYLDESIHSCWIALLLPKGKRRYEELRAKGSLDGPDAQRPAPSADAVAKRGSPAAAARNRGPTRAPRASKPKP
jgi:AcrR family transcriptional regulator